jgi:hypothetical protein
MAKMTKMRRAVDMAMKFRVRSLIGSVIVIDGEGKEVGRHETRAAAMEERNRRNGRIFPKPKPNDKRYFRFYTNNRGVSKVYNSRTGQVVKALESRGLAFKLKKELETAARAA